MSKDNSSLEEIFRLFKMRGANPGERQREWVEVEAERITDYIAECEHALALERQLGPVDSGRKERAQKHHAFYAYFRDELGAKTIGDVHNMLAKRKIDPKLVELWIDEGLLVDPIRLLPTRIGYPEYAAKLDEAQSRVYRAK